MCQHINVSTHRHGLNLEHAWFLMTAKAATPMPANAPTNGSAHTHSNSDNKDEEKHP